MFEKKGIIVAEMKKGATFDDAESDAIEMGAEDVNLVEEKILEFSTGEYDLASVSRELTKAGYTCMEATIAYIPNTATELGPIEAKALQKLVDMLMEDNYVTAVHCTAA